MLLAPIRNRWLSATAQVGIEVTATSDHEITYQSLAMSLMTALRLRSCLVTARDRHPPNRDHVSMAMVRINRHLPDGLSLIHICRCRRLLTCRSRWSPYH